MQSLLHVIVLLGEEVELANVASGSFQVLSLQHMVNDVELDKLEFRGVFLVVVMTN